MKKVTRTLALVLALLLLTASLSGCGGSGTDVKWDLSMAVNGTDTQIDSLVANHFAELVAERSNGSIVINVFPNDTLAGGNATKGIEYIAVGGADMGAYATSVLAGLEPKISVATIPWALTTYQQARMVIDGTGGEYYAKLLAAKGITYLGSFHNGFRQLTNSKRPVTKPEDLEGLKLRVPGGDVYMAFFRALGANPTAMSWSEVFTAIQQGTIDGQENGCSITKSAKMDEVQKYMTIWNYSYENDLFVVNTKIWDSLDEETQQIIQECATEACEWGRDKLETEEADLIQGFKDSGMQVEELTADQLAVFQEKVAPTLQQFKEQYGAEACAAFGIE